MTRMAPDGAYRARDFVVAASGLIVLSPVIAGTALLVRSKLGSPVLFTQERPGRDGRPFRLYKFRSMIPVDPERGLVDDEDRLTPFGQFLRASSLDELPSLVNVLRGDMSLVGPRPLLMQYLERYSPEQTRRHEVRPGITGWAQIAGRNAVSWDEKLALDVWYVDHRSMALDLRIILRTLGAVLRRTGISAEGHVTSPEFAGSGESPALSRADDSAVPVAPVGGP